MCAHRCMPGVPTDQHADPQHAHTYLPADAIALLAEPEQPAEDAVPRALGLTAVSPRMAEAAWCTLFTGVDAAHRRAGIARALKTESFLRPARRSTSRGDTTTTRTPRSPGWTSSGWSPRPVTGTSGGRRHGDRRVPPRPERTGRPVPGTFARPGAPQVWLFAGALRGPAVARVDADR
jgi:hypothetical protein